VQLSDLRTNMLVQDHDGTLLVVSGVMSHLASATVVHPAPADPRVRTFLASSVGGWSLPTDARLADYEAARAGR
jgi:hypothetical protein